MSSTRQPKREGQLDVFKTPSWAVETILDKLPMNGAAPTTIIEPCCGDGEIIRTLESYRRNPLDHYIGVDIRRVEKVGDLTFHSDFLKWQPPVMADFVITNPPFNQALGFLKHALECVKPGVVDSVTGGTGQVWLLLRAAFLESEERYEFLRTHWPDFYPLPKRPSFYDGQPHWHGTDDDARYCERTNCTDSTMYAWFRWWNVPWVRTEGRTGPLPLTSLAKRNGKTKAV